MNNGIKQLYLREIKKKHDSIIDMIKQEYDIELLVRLVAIDLKYLLDMCYNFGEYIGGTQND